MSILGYLIKINSNGLSVEDTEDIQNLNENLVRETIQSILKTIAKNRFNSDIFKNLTSNMSVETLDRTRNILSRPAYDLQDLEPIY